MESSYTGMTLALIRSLCKLFNVDVLKTKFVKLGPLVGKVRWNHEEDLVCATFHGPGVV